MIKNLLEPDANQPEQNRSETKTNADEPSVQIVAAPQYVEVNEAEYLLENPEPAGAPTFSAEPPEQQPEPEPADETVSQTPVAASDETADYASPYLNALLRAEQKTKEPTLDFSETDSDQVEAFSVEQEKPANDFEPPVEAENEILNQAFAPETVSQETNAAAPETLDQKTNHAATDVIIQNPAETQSFAETARQSGLAYAAAITLFASVVFMLIVGWFADLLFGTSPWGKVGGIALGSLIGFIQLFRITSQIFKNKS